MHDLRAALRDLRRHPIFAVTVVLTIGVGIAATTAAFALLSAVFFARLPVHDQDRLVTLWATDSAHGRPQSPLPWDTRYQLARRNGAFVDLAAVRAGEPWPYVAREGTRTVRLGRTAVSGNFFELLGVRPQLGRLLRPADDIPGGPDLVVLSDQLWRRAFAADSGVIARQLTFEGGVYQVIGVAPPEFSYPNGTDAWTPVARELHNRWNASPEDWTRFWFGFIARLRPGATLSSAKTELETVLQLDSASGKYGSASSGPRLPSWGEIERYSDVVLGKEVRPAVVILFGAVALVLIIACTNIAGLFLARGFARAPELSVRAALGASSGQLVAHLLAQPAILVLTAGFVGAIGSAVLVRGAVVLAPPELPMLAAAHVDARVLAFAAAITTAALVACALAPVRRSARPDAGASLRTNARSITGGPGTTFMRRALVAAQVALGLVVLSSAGQLSTTLAKLLEGPLGFDSTHLLFFTLDQTPWPIPSSPDSLKTYFDRWDASFDRLTQLMPEVPGFSAVTTTLRLPFHGMPTAPYTVDGREASSSASAVVPLDFALDNYFGVMGVPILRGRPFTRKDSKSAPLVAVVSASFARQEWPGQDAIGHRIRLIGDSASRWRTIVGVAGDSRYGDIASASAATVYFSARQTDPGAPWYVVRTRSDPRKAIPLLEHTIQEADPAFGATRVTTGPEVLASRLSRLRVLTTLLALLSVTALLLAATGLFGVLSTYVRERRRELGVRSALGASPTQLRALVLSQTLSVGAAGTVCGVPLAVATAHILRALIPDAMPIGVPTLLAIATVLVGVLGAAAYMPTVRAARVDIRETLAAE